MSDAVNPGVEGDFISTPFMPGALLLRPIFSSSWGFLVILGGGIGVVVEIMFLWRKEIVKAYAMPFLPVYFFTPWFMNWYALWSLPIFALFASPGIIAFVSGLLIFIQLALPIFVLPYALIYLLLFYGTRELMRFLNYRNY